jgi:hypothetical protein
MVSEVTRQTGRLEWAGKVEEGLIVRSLCGECNSRGGGQYGSHYVEFIAKLAPIVEKARDGDRIIVSGVRRPLSILKQILQTFVSANGPGFVNANPWVRRFVRNSRSKEWPRDFFAYLFATNSRGCRKSGVSSFYDLQRKRTRTVAEFSFWPLGMVLSFDPVDDYPVTPIHHWIGFDYEWSGELDIALFVNPTSSAYPLDFRTQAQIGYDALLPQAKPTVPGHVLTEIMNRTEVKGGGLNRDKFAFVASQLPVVDEK